MHTDDHRLNDLSEKIIGCAFRVHNTLGYGFLEKVYERALVFELKRAGLAVEQQKPVQVQYEGLVVGDYVCDLVIENAIIVELKSVRALEDSHIAQGLNYLKATGLKLCLILNFGPSKVNIKRLKN
ncbi:MAG: GxxExxY protein [Candidatus Zixiibacteriota bacterium]|nr:MAG: GxxExxY protein [candidate division Zixibacteria bacterium]